MAHAAELFRERFASNFNLLLDQAGAPASGLGRTRFVAAAFGISTSSAGKWLVGATAPDPWRFVEIADYFGVTVDELISRTPRRSTRSRCPSSGPRFQDGSVSLCSALLDSVHDQVELRAVSVVPPVPPSYPREATLYLMRVDSNEMEPFVTHGDMVAYVPTTSVDRDGEYVLSVRGKFVVRRIARILDSDRLKIMVGSDRYPDVDVRTSQLLPYADARDKDVPMCLHGLVVARLLVNR